MTDRIHASSSDVSDNLENWNDRAEVHAHGGYGDLDAFADDPTALTPVVMKDMAVLRDHLPDHTMQGRRLLHLQCHLGDDTLTWWRLGARDVHGLDFSPAALNHARQLAARAHAPITYVEGDARFASEAMPDKKGFFDLIVTSVGTITWLPDLREWAQSIASLLAPGGIFMIRDTHPLLFALDDDGLTIVQGWFSGTENTYETDQTYTMRQDDGEEERTGGIVGKAEAPGPRITHTTNHNWAHDFQEMTGVLIDAGLTIRALGEHDISDWKALPMLEYDKGRQGWVMPEGLPRIPLTFSLVAQKLETL